ncbi:hypothetical protein LLG96_07525 [bacterium]|nr:hypothetical protein [bacterium]
MKSRILIPLLLLLLIMIIGGYFFASKFFNINQKARDYLTGRASELLGVNFEASSVVILPWSITIRNARLKIENIPLNVEVDRVRISFDFFDFVKNHFKPLYGTEQIYLDHPVFTKILNPSEASGESLNFEKIPIISLKNIPFLRININKGSLVLRRENETSVFAQNVSGWIDGIDQRVIYLNVEGNVLSVKKNTTFKGVLDRVEDNYYLDIKSSECSIAGENIRFLSGDIRPTAGLLNFSLHMEQKDTKFFMNGDYVLRNGSFDLEGHKIGVTNVFVDGTVSEKEIVFDSISGTVWDVNPELSGRLSLEHDPSLKLTVRAKNVELSKLLTDIYPDRTAFPSGSIDLDATVEGPLSDLKTTAVFSSDALAYEKRRVRNFFLKMRLGGEKIIFDEFRCRYEDYAFRASGESSFDPEAEQKDFRLNLNVRKGADSALNYNVWVKGITNFEKETYSADFTGKRATADSSGLYTVSGTAALLKDKLDFTLKNDHVSLKGTVDSVFDKPELLSSVELRHMPVMEYLGHESGDVFINGTGTVAGDRDEARLDGDFSLQVSNQVTSDVQANILSHNILTKSRRFDVNARMNNFVVRYSGPISLKLHAVSDSSGITAEVYDGDIASLNVRAGLDGGNLSGNLYLDKFPLETIIDIFKREEFSHSGKLTGKAVIGGTLKAPFFRTPEPIVMTDLVLSGVDRLSGSGNVSGKIGELTFSDVRLKRDNIPVMQAHGIWVSGSPFVLEADGKNVELGAIGDIISTSMKCDGKVDYRFTMSFTRKDGTVNGDFSFADGHFLDIPIDEAHGVLGGGSTGFIVNDFTVKKEGIYTGKGSASSGYFWEDSTEAPGLKMNLELQGDLLLSLPYLTTAIKKATGQCQLNVEIGGTWQDPFVLDAELYVTNGTIHPAYLINKVTDVTAILKIDPEFQTMSGYKAVRVVAGSGIINNNKLLVHNIHIGDKDWDTIKRPGLLSVVNNDVNLDFGIITGKFERSKNRERPIELHVPGFMKPKETGTFELSGDAGGAFFVGAAEYENSLTPYIAGKILVRSGDVTYPLLQDESSDSDSTSYLSEIYWDINVTAGASVYYVNEINQKWRLVGTNVARVFTKIDESSFFKVEGRLADGSFRVTADARSESGSISYFGADFDIERVEFELDTIREDMPAILTGRARTVVHDSTGVPTEIYLNASTVNSKSDQRRRALGRVEVQEDPMLDKVARRTFDVEGLGTIEIEFSSTNPSDDSQEKILAKLGIAPETLGNYTARALTNGLNTYYTNMWLRPFEDIVKRYTKIDVVRFTPSVLGNFMKSQIGFKDRLDPENDYMLFDESRVMLGEYFFKEWFLSYQGQYGLNRDFLNRRERGFFHELDLQYNLRTNTRLQLKYLYDDVMKEGERRIEIRHDFEF